MSFLYTLLGGVVGVALAIGLIPSAFQLVGRLIGGSIKSRTLQRRELLFNRAIAEEKDQAEKSSQSSKQASSSTSLDEEWEKVNESSGDKTPPQPLKLDVDEGYNGIISFFHPFCNAGGGGERVLFAGIRATQGRYPNALCLVYTGDHDASKQQILTNVRNRFNIELDSARIAFLYLSTRDYVLASKWPHFTLLGQSLGSLILAWDAFNLLAPDIFIDTMGYAFTLALCKWLFPNIPTGAYVHYPTISIDMLSSLHDDEDTGRGLNAGAGKGWRGKAKQWYWELFAKMYCWVGGTVDVVMTNSSWTQKHIASLWGPARIERRKKFPIVVVYPPCAVEELQHAIPVDEGSEKQRTNSILYIAQFRPEKMHQIVIDAFANFLKFSSHLFSGNEQKPKLILVGSVRDDQDEKRVYKLRLQAQDIKESVEFVINAKWSQILDLLKNSSVGVNAMWNEHFGIGVVEYQAAGLISVVNDSGGPKEDIVVDIDGLPTGFHASTEKDFSEAFTQALSLSPEDKVAMRLRARKSALRFSEEVFAEGWSGQIGRLVDLSRR